MINSFRCLHCNVEVWWDTQRLPKFCPYCGEKSMWLETNRDSRETKTLNPQKDNVDHPKHYGGADNPFEAIKVLRNWLTKDEFTGFLKGNIIKYHARARSKGQIEDYKKANWYSNYLIKYLDEQ